MSISLSGRLRVKRITGANGPFCVGDLETEIGEFRIKDAVLDQFDEGLYQGQFWVQQIFPWSYSTNGRMVIEIRAKLADLQIEGHTRARVEARDSVEPDPAKETPMPDPLPSAPPTTAASKERPVPADDNADTADTPPQLDPTADNASDQSLFGELFAAVVERQPVKLDPTIDRILFRRQRDRLKSLGYTFQASQQSWIITT